MLDDLPEPGVQRRVAVAGRARPYHPGAAEHGRDAGDQQGVDVEQRQPAQHRLTGSEAAALGDALAAGQLAAVGVRGDLRGAGRPPGVHESGQVRCLRQPCAGQVAGRQPGHHLVQVGCGEVGSPAGQDRPGAVRAMGPQRQHGGHARLAGHREHAVPQRLVQFGPGGDDDAGPGPADQPGQLLAAQAGIDRGGDPGRLRGQRGRVEHRGVRPAERDRVLAPDPEGDQSVGDLGHRARQVGIGPGHAARVVARVRDPLRGDAVGPGAGGIQQQLVGRVRQRQDPCGAHGVFPTTVLRCVPRSSRPSGEAIVAVITAPSRR
jgi:hypothetical protein